MSEVRAGSVHGPFADEPVASSGRGVAQVLRSRRTTAWSRSRVRARTLPPTPGGRMALSPFRRFVGRIAVGALALAVPVALAPVAASAAAPTELFISEYVEGSSQNKALEIYNGTDTAV